MRKLSRRHSRILLVTLAILVGVTIGFFFGNWGGETKSPGEAIRTTDATGRWHRYTKISGEVNAEVLTNMRIRLIMQAVPTYALLHAGRVPETLDALVASGLLGKDIIRDGWDAPFVYTVDDEKQTFSVRSNGSDGVPSADDIPRGK